MIVVLVAWVLYMAMCVDRRKMEYNLNQSHLAAILTDNTLPQPLVMLIPDTHDVYSGGVPT